MSTDPASIIDENTRRLALLLLFGVAFLNYLDRNVLGILIPAIKKDLSLSDSQIGFISGPAFSLFYAVAGIPIARLADRVARRKVIAVAMTLWSAMTALCGLTANFWQLALARVLVGVGEAGATPPSHALIADLFPRDRRARALALYSLGSAAGLIIGFMIAGWLTQAIGWRTALFGFGTPGVLLALLIFLKLPEPPRGGSDGIAVVERPPLGLTLRTLLSRRTFVHNAIGSGLFAAMYYACLSWTPSFFVRTHHLSLGEIGTWLSLAIGIGQLGGTMLGGIVGDRLAKRDLRWLMWVAALTTAAGTPFLFVVYLSPAPALAFVALAFPIFLGVMQSGPQHATTQTVAPPAMRATGAATYLLIVSLIGGSGSLLVGLLSDALAPALGAEALGHALLIVLVVTNLWSAIHFWLAARTLREDVARA